MGGRWRSLWRWLGIPKAILSMVSRMKKLDEFEQDLLKVYEMSEFMSITPSKVKLGRFKAAAATTFIRDKKNWMSLSRRLF